MGHLLTLLTEGVRPLYNIIECNVLHLGFLHHPLNNSTKSILLFTSFTDEELEAPKSYEASQECSAL